MLLLLFVKYFGLTEPPSPQEIPVPSVEGVWTFSERYNTKLVTRISLGNVNVYFSLKLKLFSFLVIPARLMLIIQSEFWQV